MFELVRGFYEILQPKISTALKHSQTRKKDNQLSQDEENHLSQGFQFNIPVLFLVLFSLPSMLTLANKVSIEVLLTGLCITYAFDYLDLKEGTLMSLIITLCATWITMYLSSIHLVVHSVGNVFMVLNSGLVMAILGIWGFLQFKWVYKSVGVLPLALEQILLIALPILCAPRLLSTIISITGVTGNSPYILSLLYCAYLHFFGSRLRTSLLCTAFLAAASYVLPVFAYAALHVRSFQWMALEPNLSHIANIATLFAIPSVFMAREPRQYLWWLSSDDPEEKKYNHQRFRYIRLVLCLGFLPLGFWMQMNILLGSYRYLTSVPFFTAVVLYSTATIALSYVATVLINGFKGKIHRLAACYMSSLAALCYCLGFGVSIIVLPLPVASAFFLCDFFFSPSWVQFLVAGISGIIATGWWLTRSLWFLDYEFYISVLPLEWSLNMRHTTVALLLFQSLSVMAVPFIMGSRTDTTSEEEHPLLYGGRAVVLLFQGGVLAFLEQLLYEQQYSESNATGNTFYSPFLIFMTTMIGVYFVSHSHRTGKLGSNWSSLIASVYLGKVGMLLAPAHTTMIALFLNLLGPVRLYFSFQDSEHFSLNQGYLYFVFSGVVSIVTRHAVASQIIPIVFMDAANSIDRMRLPETRAIGLSILIWGVSMLPFAYGKIKVYNDQGRPVKFMKNVALIMIVVGMLWTVWQPALHHDSSFMAWFDILTVFVGVLCLVFPLPRHAGLRLPIFIFMGAASGFMFCKSLMPHSALIPHLLFVITICTTFTFASLVIYSAHFPLDNSYTPTIWLYVMFLGSLSLARASTSVIDFQYAVYSVATVLNVLLSLAMKFKLSGRPLVKMSSEDKNERATSFKSVPNSEELAVTNNFSVGVGFIFGLILNATVGEWSYATFLALPGIFLLLHRDNYWFEYIGEEKRYLVVIAVAQFESLLLLLRDALSAIMASGFSIRFTSAYMINMIVVFLFCLPAHIHFIRFILHLHRPSIRPILVCLGLCCIGYFLTPVAFATSVFIWNIMGMIGLAFMLFTSIQYSTQGVTLL
eukprot:gb/GECH01014885.1/.p1 GENE.gb/GECH01014885.1/~~gb/GECH01014885.1/.p1  ORF type:complete len:1038 (+),score=148.47 gb/GECH01014885.1/:1-3114(+)